jgi:hypothetical protein
MPQSKVLIFMTYLILDGTKAMISAATGQLGGEI